MNKPLRICLLAILFSFLALHFVVAFSGGRAYYFGEDKIRILFVICGHEKVIVND
jgi:hypothetical protein